MDAEGVGGTGRNTEEGGRCGEIGAGDWRVSVRALACARGSCEASVAPARRSRWRVALTRQFRWRSDRIEHADERPAVGSCKSIFWR